MAECILPRHCSNILCGNRLLERAYNVCFTTAHEVCAASALARSHNVGPQQSSPLQTLETRNSTVAQILRCSSFHDSHAIHGGPVCPARFCHAGTGLAQVMFSQFKIKAVDPWN